MPSPELLPHDFTPLTRINGEFIRGYAFQRDADAARLAAPIQ